MAEEHPGAAGQLSVVAENVGSHLTEVSRDVCENVTAEIPELRDDATVVRILQASVTENVAALLHIFENDIPLDIGKGLAPYSTSGCGTADRTEELEFFIREPESARCHVVDEVVRVARSGDGQHVDPLPQDPREPYLRR